MSEDLTPDLARMREVAEKAATRLTGWLDDFDRDNADDHDNDDFEVGQDELIEVPAEALRAILAAQRPLLDRIAELEGERDELAAKVFVPGVRRCAKCSLRLVTSTLHVETGAISANDTPQACPNGCGPMWPISEREAGNDLCDRLDASEGARNLLSEKLERRTELLTAAEAQVSALTTTKEHSDDA